MLLVQEPLLGEIPHTKEIDEADETLSLCDLPLYSDQSVEEYWYDDLSTESQGSSSMSSLEQDYFEFFSQELSSSTSDFPPENIVFCGKLIPYKQLDTSENDSSHTDESSKKQTKINKKRSWGIFRWRLGSKKQVQSKNGKKSTALVHKKDHHVSSSSSKSPEKMHKQGKVHDFPVHKMSMLTSSSSGKARWYLFLFGISRFSTEVELRDIKSRKSRRHRPSPPPPLPPSPTLRRKSDSGLWGLIRVLSCGGNHHPNTMVEASITCSPQE